MMANIGRISIQDNSGTSGVGLVVGEVDEYGLGNEMRGSKVGNELNHAGSWLGRFDILNGFISG
jgi:hypothetical protein